VRNNAILRANNRDLSGINQEFLCVKGRFGFDFTCHKDRVMHPLVRRNGKLEPTTWEAAMDEAATRLAAVRAKSGPDAIGFIGSNRTSNEENYLLSRMARATVGTNNVDHHRTADYASLARALGGESDRAVTMGALGMSRAILLIGNDTGTQSPLVDWRIREAVRHVGAHVYVVDDGKIKLEKRAKLHANIPEGAEAAAVAALTGKGSAPQGAADALAAIKKAVEAESDVAILFGAGVTGQAVADLVAWGNKLPGRTRYMALGDYANSRGAVDMGLLPDSLPGYSPLDDAGARQRFGAIWGATLPDKAGLTAKAMLDAAAAGKLKALYVVGANPFHTFGLSGRPAGLELLIAHELFLTETAREADIVLPAAAAYEKNGSVTNTAGEVQLLRKAADPPGVRSDFDLLRILSHMLEKKGLGKALHLRNAEAAFEEIRANVPGYNLNLPELLTGGAALAAAAAPKNGHRPYDVPVGAIRSAHDNLFTSGTLGRYCSMIESLAEARGRE